jgi:integrase
MTSAGYGFEPALNIRSHRADNQIVNSREIVELISAGHEIRKRWGLDFLAQDYHTLIESAFGSDGAKQHMVDHIDCPACKAFDELMKADLLGMAGQTFPEAAKVWQPVRKNSKSLRKRTHEVVDEYVRALSKFFANIQMRSINPGMLMAYQLARKSNALVAEGKFERPWKQTASHSRVNHEIGLLKQTLKACNEWEKIKPFYFPLPINAWSPRQILSEKEEDELFRKVAGYPEAELAYCVAAITNNTTASGIELRRLKIENILLRPTGEVSEIYIPREACKNDSRPREIALNKVARWAVKKVFKRANDLGSIKPEHYLFPFRIKRCNYNPDRPATRWFLRCSWNHLRKLSGFTDLRPHDLRHLAITRLLEKGVDGDLVNAISGHISQRMREYYSHQRTRVRHKAAQKIEPEYNIRKLEAEGRRRVKHERPSIKRRPKQESMA